MDSKLQIISGMYRGRRLCLPDGARPTQNMARAGLFNMLCAILDDAPMRVWDAFAGSGALGLECLSRWGECRVVFSDVAPGTVRRNVTAMNIDARATIMTGDAMTMVPRVAPDMDLIFVDPPYADAEVGAAFVRCVGTVARSGTILVWEQDTSNAAMPGDAWEIIRDRTYGRARFLILRRV